MSARRALGGGVLLELSHEIHYARWLCGEAASVGAWMGHVSDLDTDVEDVAELTLEFERGIFGSIHLDMIQRVPVRYCRLMGAEGTLTWNVIAREARLDRPGEQPVMLPVVTHGEDSDSYIEEMRHFLHCVNRGERPQVSGEDGRRVVEIVLAARRAADCGERVKL